MRDPDMKKSDIFWSLHQTGSINTQVCHSLNLDLTIQFSLNQAHACTSLCPAEVPLSKTQSPKLHQQSSAASVCVCVCHCMSLTKVRAHHTHTVFTPSSSIKGEERAQTYLKDLWWSVLCLSLFVYIQRVTFIKIQRRFRLNIKFSLGLK